MKKNFFSKLMATVLAVGLIVGNFPSVARAEDNDDPSSKQVVEKTQEAATPDTKGDAGPQKPVSKNQSLNKKSSDNHVKASDQPDPKPGRREEVEATLQLAEIPTKLIRRPRKFSDLHERKKITHTGKYLVAIDLDGARKITGANTLEVRYETSFDGFTSSALTVTLQGETYKADCTELIHIDKKSNVSALNLEDATFVYEDSKGKLSYAAQGDLATHLVLCFSAEIGSKKTVEHAHSQETFSWLELGNRWYLSVTEQRNCLNVEFEETECRLKVKSRLEGGVSTVLPIGGTSGQKRRQAEID